MAGSTSSSCLRVMGIVDGASSKRGWCWHSTSVDCESSEYGNSVMYWDIRLLRRTGLIILSVSYERLLISLETYEGPVDYRLPTVICTHK